jgi:ATP-dependent DNA helicase RecQ
MTPKQLSQLQQRAQMGLCHYWGYAQFRPLQGEIVSTILQAQDVLAVLPTGAGKSLCYQLPALLQDGLTLVVSPLVALMENQVQDLSQRQIAAALLHSEQSRNQRQQTLWKLEQQKLKLLYLSPESLLSTSFWPRLLTLAATIRLLVIDEAHCVTQWGSSFRPVYRRLGTIRPALQSHTHTSTMAIAAFTATADNATQRDIQQALGLRSTQTFRSSPYRPNLYLQIKWVWTPAARRAHLRTFLTSQHGSAGLVYTRSRRESEALADWLQRQGHTTAAYHAGLNAPQRRLLEQQWLNGTMPFVICTAAFGMGVDKSNVRWVCHWNPPLTLAEYLQEIGRAGRDGQAAQALLLASEPTGLLDNTDRRRQDGFLKQQRVQTDQARSLVAQLPPEGYLPDLLARYPQAELTLAILQAQGQLIWLDPFHYRITSTARIALKQPPASVAQYLSTRGCRWQFLLAAFGFGREAQGLTCGHCDRCCPKSP